MQGFTEKIDFSLDFSTYFLKGIKVRTLVLELPLK